MRHPLPPPPNSRRCRPGSRAHATIFAILIALAASPSIAQADDATATLPTAPPAEGESSWRELFQCGPNSLYVFLKLQGWQGSLEDIREIVPVRDYRGCTLEDLRQAADRLGIATLVVRTDFQGLGQIDGPVIVHHEGGNFGPYGHFNVAVSTGKATPDGVPLVTLLDPLKSIQYDLALPEFQRTWTSFALIRKPPRDGLNPAIGGLFLAAGGLVLITSSRMGRRLRAPGKGEADPAPQASTGPIAQDDSRREANGEDHHGE